MMETGREYAQALFMLAKENSQEDQYLEALEQILSCFNDNPLYIDFLSSVNISKKERTDAIDEAFGSLMPEHVVSFLKVLCERERIGAFKDCVNEYKALHGFASKTAMAKITSAVSLSDAEKESVVSKLEKMKGCSVEAEYHIDSSILGGIIIETDGTVIDNSVKSRLADVKEVINREQ
ncbi:MAG: ATP synthase F1 subunit delta [Clostridia bacterium]|nr:ATP synthase F1 subunit delta [Clostridia bacterium]